MITSIEIENFKGISGRQRIEFAPLTLIFGANSAGKSTIVHALHYFREVLTSGNGDVDEIAATNGELRLGGFKNLIHKHDRDEQNGRISIRVDVKSDTSNQFQQSIPCQKLEMAGSTESEVFRSIQTVGIEISVGEHFQEYRSFNRPDHPVVVSFKLYLDGQIFLATEITDLLYDEELMGSYANMYLIDLAHPSLEMQGERTVLQEVLGVSDFRVGKYDSEKADAPFEIQNTLGALPTSRSVTSNRILEQLMIDVVAHTSNILQKSCHLGPIREIPERGRRTSVNSNWRSWYRGQVAWHKLTEKDPKGFFMDQETDGPRHWWVLDLKNWIDAPFSLERIGVWTSHEGDWNGGYPKGAEQRDVEVVLRDLRTDTLVSLSDVGVGISQFIPVLVAARDQSLAIAYIEQPELHLHPKQQAMLGDLFAGQTSRHARWFEPQVGKQSEERTIIIETHSELLLLRMLRRIRETKASKQSGDSDVPRLNSQDLRIYAVESTAEGTQFRTFPISDSGKFIGAWPEGFFDERIDEV